MEKLHTEDGQLFIKVGSIAFALPSYVAILMLIIEPVRISPVSFGPMRRLLRMRSSSVAGPPKMDNLPPPEPRRVQGAPCPLPCPLES